MADLAVVDSDTLGLATAEQLNGLAFPHVRFTSQQLVFHEETPIEEWNAVGAVLKGLEKNVQWWLGDWLNFGERKYKEMYTQALDDTDYSYGTLANIKWVAGKIESSRRHENVPFAHHQEVAPLKPDEQDELLDKVEREGLTHKQLRSEVIERKQLAKGGVPTWVIDASETGPDFLVADSPNFGAQVHPDGNIYLYDRAGRKFHIPDLGDMVTKLYSLRDAAKRHFGEWPQK